MDHRRFLGAATELTLPFLGGTFLETGTRRLRVDRSAVLAPGFHRFKVTGRNAVAIERAEPIDLSDRPAHVGHFAPTTRGAYLVAQGGEVKHLELVPEDEPAALTVVRAREWHDGAWLYAETMFESEVEELVRQRLEEKRGCDDVKGVGASLRTAFAIALTARLGRELGVAIAPAEMRGRVKDIASRGEPAAREVLEETDARRRQRLSELDATRWDEAIEGHARAAVRRAAHQGRGAAAPTVENAEERAIAALDHAGARFLSARRSGVRGIEVRYEFMNERFITVVDAITLQVRDAGVCLDGADYELTLDSLPSAIREAIETDVLVITSR